MPVLVPFSFADELRETVLYQVFQFSNSFSSTQLRTVVASFKSLFDLALTLIDNYYYVIALEVAL